MNQQIENKIFRHCSPDFSKFEKYGFIKKGTSFVWEKMFANDEFKAFIELDEDGTVFGKVVDCAFGDEYTTFRVENVVGEFANSIKMEYESLLQDIKEKCFKKELFLADQANRIVAWVHDTYGDEFEFPWSDPKYSSAAIVRDPGSQKWYAIVMEVTRDKIQGASGSGLCNVMNVKLNPEKISNLLGKKGYYVCYHMNKKQWISIILDDTLPDEEVFSLIKESHDAVARPKKPNAWIVPSNPKIYSIIEIFDHSSTSIWTQHGDMKVGDLFFLYLTSPHSCLYYKCQIVETDLPTNDVHVKNHKLVRIKLMERYGFKRFPLKDLADHGLSTVRGVHHMPQETLDYIEKKSK